VHELAATRRLIVDGRLRCPKDGALRNVLAYGTFDVVEEFADELNVVLKCPCGHIFSPGFSSDELAAFYSFLSGSAVGV
jgi:hypothetical protein